MPGQDEEFSKEAIKKEFRDKCVEIGRDLEGWVQRTNRPMSSDELRTANRELLSISEAFQSASYRSSGKLFQLVRRPSTEPDLATSEALLESTREEIAMEDNGLSALLGASFNVMRNRNLEGLSALVDELNRVSDRLVFDEIETSDFSEQVTALTRKIEAHVHERLRLGTHSPAELHDAEALQKRREITDLLAHEKITIGEVERRLKELTFERAKAHQLSIPETLEKLKSLGVNDLNAVEITNQFREQALEQFANDEISKFLLDSTLFDSGLTRREAHKLLKDYVLTRVEIGKLSRERAAEKLRVQPNYIDQLTN